MRGDAATLATVPKLRGRGVQPTIDDFGTGLPSLSQPRRFPLSKLKIDSSFVDDIVSAPDAAAVIPAIIAGAQPEAARACRGRGNARAAALLAGARL